MPNEFDSFLDDEEEDTSEDEESSESGAADSQGSGSESSEDVEKRIRDLQSKADKAEARANKLQKQIEAQTKSQKAAKDGNADGVVPPEVQKWLDTAKERATEAAFESDERFKKYKVSPEFIQGDSPDELRQRAKAFADLLTEIEGQARNDVLVEHGYRPEPATSERADPKNYRTMSTEEFNKEVDRALNSGTLRRS